MDKPIQALEMFELLGEAIRPHPKDCQHNFQEDDGEAYCPNCELRLVLAADEYVDQWGEIVANTTEPYDTYLEDLTNGS